MAFVSMAASAQLFEKKGVSGNKGGSVGIIGGAFGIYDEHSSGAFGVNGTAYGVYFDLMGWPRKHARSTDVKKHENEKSCISVHVGYQLPLTKWLNFTPVVGYTAIKKGTTDGSKWSVSSSGIYNSFDVKEKTNGFDYGGILTFNIKALQLYAAGTRYGAYGGIGFKF